MKPIDHVALARWPVERCLEDGMDELGFSHFPVRKYYSITRFLSITQVSRLVLAHRRQGKGKTGEISLRPV